MSHRNTTRLPLLCALCALLAASLVLAPVKAAKAAPDLSTPKKAALAFASALEKGDADAVKAASTGTDEDYKTLMALSDMVQAMKRFQAAAVDKYGDAAKALPSMSDALTKQIEGSEEKINGDTATLVNKDNPEEKHPATLKKVGGQWKMDLKTMSDDPQFGKMKDNAPKMAKAIDGVTADVKSGKHATFVEAMQALGQTMAKFAPQAPAQEPPATPKQ